MDPIVQRLAAKFARDFATPEALRNYLHEHPNADKSKHHVVQEGHRSPGGLKVKTQIDKDVAKEISDIWKNKPSGNIVDSVRKKIEEGHEVPIQLLDRAALQLHNEANKPGLDKNKAKALRGLRDKLKNHAQLKEASLGEGVIARYLDNLIAETSPVAITFPREFHLPPNVRPTPAHVPEGTDLAVWTWEAPVGPSAEQRYFLIIFAGKSNKPLVGPYFYRTPQARQSVIDKTVQDRLSILNYKKQRQDERRNFVHDIQKGEIFSTSWGYDQTNVDFYEVVEVKGKMIVVREIGSKIESSNGNQDKVVPMPGHYVGKPTLVKPTTGGGFTVDDHHASKWDGRPKYETSFGAGH